MDRQFVARVLKHMRSLGWGPTTYGWANGEGTVRVEVYPWQPSGCSLRGGYVISVRRRHEPAASRYTGYQQTAQVRDEREAVDVLCALGVLPAELSSMWEAAKARAERAERERDSLARRLALRFEETEKLRAALAIHESTGRSQEFGPDDDRYLDRNEGEPLPDLTDTTPHPGRPFVNQMLEVEL